MSISGFATSFGLGYIYFVAAVPAGTAIGLPVLVAAAAAWTGYAAAVATIVLAGAPARDWIIRRFRIRLERDPSKGIWRAWERWGLAGLGLLAPVTIGPQAGGLLALAVGERRGRVFLFLSFGALPWCILFAALTRAGSMIVR